MVLKSQQVTVTAMANQQALSATSCNAGNRFSDRINQWRQRSMLDRCPPPLPPPPPAPLTRHPLAARCSDWLSGDAKPRPARSTRLFSEFNQLNIGTESSNIARNHRCGAGCERPAKQRTVEMAKQRSNYRIDSNHLRLFYHRNDGLKRLKFHF